jgi:hypothetical protein
MVHRSLIRAQALLLTLMLIATPVALLARPSHPESRCNGMCCRPQKSHSTPAVPVSSELAKEGMLCHRGIAGHLAMCVAPSSAHEDRDAIAPLPPAILSEQDAMDGPRLHDEKLWRHADSTSTGFASVTFEPPRS